MCGLRRLEGSWKDVVKSNLFLPLTSVMDMIVYVVR